MAKTVADHLAAINDVGYSIVEDAVPISFIDELVDTVERLERELGIGTSTNRFEGFSTTRIYNLLAHGAPFTGIPIMPSILSICEGVLDEGLLVSSLSSIAIGPGEQAQPIHADDQVIGLAKPHKAVVCNTMWALTDFTDENGATRLIPGSHLADHSPDLRQSYDTIPAEMSKGSVLVWHGSLWHGGGANRTDARRIGVAMNYCAGFIRQQENQQLGLSPETLRAMPPRLQELVGLGIYRGLIGHIDKHSARDLLGTSGTDSMIWDYASQT